MALRRYPGIVAAGVLLVAMAFTWSMMTPSVTHADGFGGDPPPKLVDSLPTGESPLPNDSTGTTSITPEPTETSLSLWEVMIIIVECL
ncbi:MAG TPA: hypothetical protein VN285_07620 [Candidatus Deferrimicrobium sp.]|nr:hypothetical protein [Candidatus Deferrimicrobium sp.]